MYDPVAFSGAPPTLTQYREDQQKPLSHHPYWEKVIQGWEKVMKPGRLLQEVYEENVHNQPAGFRED